MDKKIVETKKAPAAIGPYSQGVELGGVFYFSGQIGLAPKNMRLREGFEGQLNQILDNIDGLLASESLTRKNIVKTTIFLTDMGDFPVINEAYANFFEEPYPARSCVEVTDLPKGALVEIEVIASRQ